MTKWCQNERMHCSILGISQPTFRRKLQSVFEIFFIYKLRTHVYFEVGLKIIHFDSHCSRTFICICSLGCLPQQEFGSHLELSSSEALLILQFLLDTTCNNELVSKKVFRQLWYTVKRNLKASLTQAFK